MRWGILERNPVKGAQPPRPVRPEPVVVDPALAQRIVGALQGSAVELPGMMAISTGMRRGEILALRWRDLDPELTQAQVRRTLHTTGRGLAFSEPKTRKSRRAVALPEIVRPFLERQRSDQGLRRSKASTWQDLDLLIDRGDGGALNPDTLSSRWRAFLQRSGLPHVTFWAIREIVHQAAGIRDEVPPAAAVDRLGALIEQEEDAGLIAAGVGQAIGLTAGSASADEIGWAIRRLLAALARDRPLALLIDDIHWAEPGLLDLIASLPELSHDPIFLLCLARTDLLESRPNWGPCVRLEPLAAEGAERLIETLLGASAAGKDVRRRIARAAGGNPLFVEELVSMLIDDGLLSREDGSWVPLGDLRRIAVPRSLSALLGARLDRLGSGERGVIERGSIEGQVFHRGAVVELLAEAERAEAPGSLRRLVERGFIQPAAASFRDDAAYAFRHILIRDTAYEAMPKKHRAELHERFADWLERAAGERVVELEEILGYHLEQAHRYLAELGPLGDHGRSLGERAGERLAAAGHRTLARGDSAATINLLSRATALLPSGRGRAEALLGLGSALWPTMDFARGDEILGEAVEAARQLGDPALEWRAVIERAFLASQVERGSWSDLEPIAREAIGALEEIADDRGLARAWRLMAMVDRFAGAVTKEMESLERAAHHARRAGDRGQEIESLVQLMVTGTWGPLPASQGIERCRGIQERAPDDRAVQMAAHECVGVYLAMLGKFEEGRAELGRGRRLIEELGLKLILANDAVFFEGFVNLLAGNPRGAERAVREALDEPDRH